MCLIVDYGLGNIGSIANMLKKVGVAATVSNNPNQIENASKIILPGVGAFDNGISNLHKSGIWESLNNAVIKNSAYILGICLGMQLMTESSEEGKLPGLGWIKAKTVRFSFDVNSKIRIPHFGWNSVLIEKEMNLFKEFSGEIRFYFAHSYHILPDDTEQISGTTKYGYEFVSAIQKKNIFGVQFHPEKSHKFGMKLLKNFSEL
ncbi:MAG: imidazole glycerol phosphate synthase subunit HisH [Candidatus Riflebacteria bacterium]|nr:imidazole glycerol phosphate synthase subunit HisH [Candidatus Riflebacteria bacterium]